MIVSTGDFKRCTKGMPSDQSTKQEGNDAMINDLPSISRKQPHYWKDLGRGLGPKWLRTLDRFKMASLMCTIVAQVVRGRSPYFLNKGQPYQPPG